MILKKIMDGLRRLGLLRGESVHYIGGSDVLPPPLSRG